MTDENPSDTPAPAGPRRRKRPAPTIDLTATEVGGAAEATSPPEPPPPPETPAGASDSSAREANRLSFFRWPYVAAGIIGGLVVTGVLFALWLTGAVPIRYAGATAMRARVSVLEMQLHELQNKQGAPADSKALEELSQRLTKLEQAATTARSAADPALLDRLSAAETAMKSAGVALAALNKRIDDIAATADAARAQTAAADKAVGELQAAARASEKNVPESVLRLSLGTAALREAVTGGEPFAAELAAVKSLGGDAGQIAALEPFAQSGVPAEAVLARELSALVPELLKTIGMNAPREGGFLDRLQANAGKLVRIRPAGETPGDDPAAIVSRIEVKAARADVAGALAELRKLPPAQRGPAEGWIKKAESRQAALAASRKLAADGIRALGQ